MLFINIQENEIRTRDGVASNLIVASLLWKLETLRAGVSKDGVAASRVLERKLYLETIDVAT